MKNLFKCREYGLRSVDGGEDDGDYKEEEERGF
jgi:hypothetical protein